MIPWLEKRTPFHIRSSPTVTPDLRSERCHRHNDAAGPHPHADEDGKTGTTRTYEPPRFPPVAAGFGSPSSALLKTPPAPSRSRRSPQWRVDSEARRPARKPERLSRSVLR